MNHHVVFTLLSDGSSDEALLRHIDWLLRRHLDVRFALDFQWADLRALRRRPTGIVERIEAAISLYPCDVLFVHRDAEKERPEVRYEEIESAWRNLDPSEIGNMPSCIGVVPVRMLEAWLLCNEIAIRRAAGNPNGQIPLTLPSLKDIESLSDPKKVLHDLLRRASGLTGRRLHKFRTHLAARLVAEYTVDFAPLLQLPAFRQLEQNIASFGQSRGWK
jgi:hypothetical protein